MGLCQGTSSAGQPEISTDIHVDNIEQLTEIITARQKLASIQKDLYSKKMNPVSCQLQCSLLQNTDNIKKPNEQVQTLLKQLILQDANKLIKMTKINEDKVYSLTISSINNQPYQQSETLYYLGSVNDSNSPNGIGIIYSSNHIYQGEIVNGVSHGKGFSVQINNEGQMMWYKGQYQNNTFSGYGFLKDFQEITYEGEFSDGKINGSAIEKNITDNYIYEGNFINSIRSGHGTWIQFVNDQDIEKYEGEFHDDQFHGFGTYTWGDKKQYEGNWQDGKLYGKGTLTYSDGKVYEGEFINDKREGYGKLTYLDSRYFEGNWKNDKQHGIGQIAEPNGQVTQCFYENGVQKKLHQ